MQVSVHVALSPGASLALKVGPCRSAVPPKNAKALASEIPSTKSPSLCPRIVKVDVSPAATAGMVMNPFRSGGSSNTRWPYAASANIGTVITG